MARTKNIPFGFDEGELRTTTVLKHRLRDYCASSLSRMARSVNVVWNYCNEAQRHAFNTRWEWRDKWLSSATLQKLTAGTSLDLALNAQTIQKVCERYVASRQTQKKRWLRFRGRKSLGWVPFSNGAVTFDGDAFWFSGIRFEPMHIREGAFHPAAGFSGSFNQDALGHWYINVTVDVRVADHAPATRVGIDLGLETLAGLSDGSEIECPRFYRKSEAKLARAQKARKVPNRIRRLHRKVANRRKDFLHKESSRIAKEYGLIVVGNVSPKQIAKSRFAKSEHDAGWADFKNMLSYKAIMRGGRCIEVSEAWTSQTCSECGALPASRPRGSAGLGIRDWLCDACGSVHRRDVNAAKNILRAGLGTLVAGVSP